MRKWKEPLRNKTINILVYYKRSTFKTYLGKVYMPLGPEPLLTTGLPLTTLLYLVEFREFWFSNDRAFEIIQNDVKWGPIKWVNFRQKNSFFNFVWRLRRRKRLESRFSSFITDERFKMILARWLSANKATSERASANHNVASKY